MLNILAFDLGASNGRNVLGSFDGEKVYINEISRFANTPVQVSGKLYWDVLRLFHEIKCGISESVRCFGDITSLAVDTWGTDFGLLDENDELFANPYHYRNSYSHGMLDEIFKIIPYEELYAKTGSELSDICSLIRLYSMQIQNHHQLKYAKTFLMMPDLFNYLLSGVKLTEYTIASSSNLISAENKKWLFEIMDILHLPKEIFTEIVQPGTVIGSLTNDVSKETGSKNIRVIATTSHDTASAVAAMPLQDSNSIFISSGTWSVIGIEVDRPIITEKAMKNNFINEGGACGKIRFSKNVMGLWFIEACRSDWKLRGEGISYAEMDDAAARATLFESFINPAHSNFVLPGDMPQKIRNYLFLTKQKVPQEKGEIVNTINQSLAMEYRKVIENIEDISGKKFSKIYIVGGGIKNRLLCQYTANATGKEVIAGYPETVCVGNILIQAMALGEIKNLDELREIVKESFPVEYYSPKDKESWDEAYNKYKKVICEGL